MVILGMAAIAVSLVGLRKQEVVARYEMRRLEARLVEQRSQLWRQEARLADLESLDAVRLRAQELRLSMEPTPTAPAAGSQMVWGR
jgi:hypothetical protein